MKPMIFYCFILINVSWWWIWFYTLETLPFDFSRKQSSSGGGGSSSKVGCLTKGGFVLKVGFWELSTLIVSNVPGLMGGYDEQSIDALLPWLRL